MQTRPGVKRFAREIYCVSRWKERTLTRSTTAKLKRGLVLAAVLVVAIYGLGLLLTSSITNLGGAVDYHAGKIEAQNNSSVGASTATSSDCGFSARRIAILQANDHPVLNQAVAKFREDLLALGYVDEVDVFAPDKSPEFGDRIYDAYLTLSIEVHQDTKPFVERDFKATIHLSAGAMPYKSHSGYFDQLTPPEIRYSLSGKIEHSSQSTQVGTPYKLIADNIAAELSGQITKQYNEWYDKYGTDFEWPDDLIGEYPEDPALPWPEGLDLDKLVDGYGLMRDRHALWTIETDDPEAIVRAFHQTYTDAGWRIEPGAVIEAGEAHERYHFRAWNESPHEVEVFEIRDDLGERGPGEVSRVCVRYQHRFDLPQIRQIIDRLLEDDANLEVLGLLAGRMEQEQRDRYYQSLAESQPSDPRTLIGLARYYHRNEQPEEARRYLIRASLSTYRAPDKSEFRGRLKKAAADMGFDEQVLDPILTSGSLSEYGYRAVDELVGREWAVGIDEAVQFYYESNGKISSVDLWLAPDFLEGGAVRLNHYERDGDGSSSWGNGGGLHIAERLHATWSVNSDRGTYTVHFRQQEDNDELFDVEVVAESNP